MAGVTLQGATLTCNFLPHKWSREADLSVQEEKPFFIEMQYNKRGTLFFRTIISLPVFKPLLLSPLLHPNILGINIFMYCNLETRAKSKETRHLKISIMIYLFVKSPC